MQKESFAYGKVIVQKESFAYGKVIAFDRFSLFSKLDSIPFV